VSKIWYRPQAWLALIAGGVALLLTAVFGLHLYMTTTATPLHPDPRGVPSRTQAAPSRQWAGAVERARQVVRAAVADRNLPGVSVAVGDGADLVWAEGFGWANLDDREPVTPATRFRIGTASTVLTSAAAGLLLEDGRLKLDEPIQTYVPEFPAKREPVTLRQLMSHLAGLGSDGGDEGPLFEQHCERPVDAFPAFADRALLFPPGTRYRYSRYGWIAVSAAIEAAAKAPFLTFMRTHVFEPLGMQDTRADAAEGAPARATPYFPRYAAEPRYGPEPMRDLDLSCYAGSSVFVSTPSDLVRFGLAIDRGTLLKPATVDVLRAPQRLASGQATSYGLGWNLGTVPLAGKPARMAGHDGDLLGGLVASLMTFPGRGLVVAVTSNTSYADTSGIASEVAQAFAQP